MVLNAKRDLIVSFVINNNIEIIRSNKVYRLGSIIVLMLNV